MEDMIGLVQIRLSGLLKGRYMSMDELQGFVASKAYEVSTIQKAIDTGRMLDRTIFFIDEFNESLGKALKVMMIAKSVDYAHAIVFAVKEQDNGTIKANTLYELKSDQEIYL